MSEKVFTDIYMLNSWGCKETASGSSSTVARTTELRSQIPMLIEKLNIKSILDCGCGDFNWMKHVDLSNVQYLGVDIVNKMISRNQEMYTKSNIRFQITDVIYDPPETADLWIARDICCFYGYSEIKKFFQKFLESNSSYLAITSIQTEQENINGTTGIWRSLNLAAAPFHLSTSYTNMKDDKQWFREKVLQVYKREHIAACPLLGIFIQEDTNIHVPLSAVEDSSGPSEQQGQHDQSKEKDPNSHLKNNISLRDVKLPGQLQGQLPKPKKSA